MALEAFADIIRRHRPAGYRIVEREIGPSMRGYAEFWRRIVCEPIQDRFTLFTFLHECGHVHYQHLRGQHAAGMPVWRQEYEADRYAIEAMKAAGLPVPRARLQEAKHVLRDYLAHVPDHETVDDEVLRYAYGRSWRSHR